jgi:hypothetical protein
LAYFPEDDRASRNLHLNLRFKLQNSQKSAILPKIHHLRSELQDAPGAPGIPVGSGFVVIWKIVK